MLDEFTRVSQIEAGCDEGSKVYAPDRGRRRPADVHPTGVQSSQCKYKFQTVSSGNQAIAYLNGEGKFNDRSTFEFPGYIITDLEMRDRDGFAVLDFLKSNPALVKPDYREAHFVARSAAVPL